MCYKTTSILISLLKFKEMRVFYGYFIRVFGWLIGFFLIVASQFRSCLQYLLLWLKEELVSQLISSCLKSERNSLEIWPNCLWSCIDPK